jgi:hypothetical protein
MTQFEVNLARVGLIDAKNAAACNQAATSRVGASALWLLALEIAEGNFSPRDAASVLLS